MQAISITPRSAAPKVIMTSAAAAKVAELISREDGDSTALRLGVRPGGCSGFSYELELDSKIDDGDIVATLDRGAFHEQLLTNPAHRTATAPVLVGQYANSTEFDDETADPFMMLVPALEQFLESYTLSTSSGIFSRRRRMSRNISTFAL